MEEEVDDGLTDQQIIDRCYIFIMSSDMSKLAEEILDMLKSPDTTKTYPIVVDFLGFVDNMNDLGQFMATHPKKILKCFDMAVGRAQQTILDVAAEEDPAMFQTLTKKDKYRVRVRNLPLNEDPIKGCLPRACDVNRFMCVQGTVVRTGQPKMLEWKRIYKCSVCHLEFEKEADLTSQEPFPYPLKCESGNIPQCNSRKFTLVDKEIECRDYQEIKVQEHMHTLGAGSIPRSIFVILMEDLVDVAKPGDDVRLVGEVIQKWKPLYPDERCDVEIMMFANHVQVNNETMKGFFDNTDETLEEFREFWKAYEDNPLLGINIDLEKR